MYIVLLFIVIIGLVFILSRLNNESCDIKDKDIVLSLLHPTLPFPNNTLSRLKDELYIPSTTGIVIQLKNNSIRITGSATTLTNGVGTSTTQIQIYNDGSLTHVFDINGIYSNAINTSAITCSGLLYIGKNPIDVQTQINTLQNRLTNIKSKFSNIESRLLIVNSSLSPTRVTLTNELCATSFPKNPLTPTGVRIPGIVFTLGFSCSTFGSATINWSVSRVFREAGFKFAFNYTTTSNRGYLQLVLIYNFKDFPFTINYNNTPSPNRLHSFTVTCTATYPKKIITKSVTFGTYTDINFKSKCV